MENDLGIELQTLIEKYRAKGMSFNDIYSIFESTMEDIPNDDEEENE